MPWDVLSDEQRELRDLVRTLARERIAPRAAEIDATHEFPWDVVELFRDGGIFGLFFDEEVGGTGTGTLLSLIAIEEVSKVCATSGLILAVQELGSLGLKLGGSDDQRAAWLPRLASGEVLAAYALTEAGSGSDSAAMRTVARRDDGEYVLDGTKRFITNAGVAGLYTVFAKTDPEAGHAGISAFLVEPDTPGLELTRVPGFLHDPYLDHHPELVLRDCRVPDDNRVPAGGNEGAKEWFLVERLFIAARCCGASERALGIARDWALERVAFGKPIAEHEGVSFQLADSLAELLAAPPGLLRWGALPPRVEEPAWIVGDNARFRAATGWQPRFDLRDGLRATIAAYEDPDKELLGRIAARLGG